MHKTSQFCKVGAVSEQLNPEPEGMDPEKRRYLIAIIILLLIILVLLCGLSGRLPLFGEGRSFATSVAGEVNRQLTLDAATQYAQASEDSRTNDDESKPSATNEGDLARATATSVPSGSGSGAAAVVVITNTPIVVIASDTALPSSTASSVPQDTDSPTITPTASNSPTATPTPTETQTPSPSPTPTPFIVWDGNWIIWVGQPNLTQFFITLNEANQMLSGFFDAGGGSTVSLSGTISGDRQSVSGTWVSTAGQDGTFGWRIVGTQQFSGNIDGFDEWCGARFGQPQPIPCFSP